MEVVFDAVVVGVGATAVMDLWAVARRRLFGIAALDYALLGRWLLHMPHGRFRHERIAAAPPMPGERALGWSAHFAIGIAFAVVLLAAFGPDWRREPTIGPALAVGIGSVAAPLLVMQPGMGLGIAASRTPRPWKARLQALVTHAFFGLGLYLAGLAAAMLSGGE